MDINTVETIQQTLLPRMDKSNIIMLSHRLKSAIVTNSNQHHHKEENIYKKKT